MLRCCIAYQLCLTIVFMHANSIFLVTLSFLGRSMVSVRAIVLWSQPFGLGRMLSKPASMSVSARRAAWDGSVADAPGGHLLVLESTEAILRQREQLATSLSARLRISEASAALLLANNRWQEQAAAEAHSEQGGPSLASQEHMQEAANPRKAGNWHRGFQTTEVRSPTLHATTLASRCNARYTRTLHLEKDMTE